MIDLDSPIRLRCGLELSNRIALAPLTNLQSHEDGTLGDDELRWLVARARGGFGLVSTCAAFVSAEGRAWNGQLGVGEDDHLAGLTRLAGEIREHGAAAIVQLHHGGSKATLAPGDRLSASDCPSIRAATPDDLRRVTADFVAAARRAEAAGFSGVEIHGANGYLFTQFLSPRENRRTDEYGGGIEGRARLLREVHRAVRAAMSPSFAVGVRISPVDVWAGLDLRLEDSVRVGGWLAEDGVDFVHLSLADAGGPPPNEEGGPPVARAFREALPDDVPVLAAGGLWDRDDAARATDAGVDVVVLGRAAIVHADWPRVSAATNWIPRKPQWTVDWLREAAVGPAFVEYLLRFPGLVEGGAPPRD